MSDASSEHKPAEEECDVVVIGGGPAGSTAAMILARAGVRVIVLEKKEFPRFQIGESFLPANYCLLSDLGLIDRVATIRHTRKLGAEFALGDADESSLFEFSEGLVGGRNETINVARAEFDDLLLNAAMEAGASVQMPRRVIAIDSLADNDARITTDAGRIHARFVLDASGQATVVGSHLGHRRSISAPHLQKIAYFEHFTGVERLTGDREGFPTVVMCREGWFWIIPLDDARTSVGLVVDRNIVSQSRVPANRMLSWGIERCPFMKRRMRGASGPRANLVRADFSYVCAPFSGPGYFLIGDAACFYDPVFATGVHVAMSSAERSARTVVDVLHGARSPRQARRDYNRFMDRTTKVLFGVVQDFYRHSFRELFLSGRGPLRIEKGLITVLSGHIHPSLPFAAWWRYCIFRLLIRVQRFIAVVPRRAEFSLMGTTSNITCDVRDEHLHDFG